jgi:death-on-curing protein
MADDGPLFLTRDELAAIHEAMLTRYGGFHGVRDDDVLTTALATPEARMNGRYVHEDLAAMAAAYLYPIARYRPFEDGNRRTAVLAALVFLALNDRRIGREVADLAEVARGAASGELDRSGVADWLRERLSEQALSPPPTAGA